MESIFVDQIGSAALVSGVFKLDLLRSTSLESDKAKVEFSPAHRLNMSVDTMLRLHQTLDRAVKELKEKNLIKEREDQSPESSH